MNRGQDGEEESRRQSDITLRIDPSGNRTSSAETLCGMFFTSAENRKKTLCLERVNMTDGVRTENSRSVR